MSDDDAAKENVTPDADATAKVERPQGSTDADAPAGAESAAADSEKTVPVERPAPERGRTSWLPIAAAFAAGVLLVGAVTAVVVFWRQADDRGNQLDARDQSTRAACDFGKAVASYDAKNLDNYFKTVNDLSTGEWGQFFGGASSALKDAMVSVQARSKLDEIHCAWESGNDSEANVVLVITQEQTNSAVPQPNKLTIPGVAQLEKKNGKWLVAKFDSPVTKGMGPGAPAAPGAPAPGGPQPPGGPQGDQQQPPAGQQAPAQSAPAPQGR